MAMWFVLPLENHKRSRNHSDPPPTAALPLTAWSCGPAASGGCGVGAEQPSQSRSPGRTCRGTDRFLTFWNKWRLITESHRAPNFNHLNQCTFNTPSSWCHISSFFFFLAVSDILLSMTVQKLVVILVLSQEEMSACPSTLPSWNQNLFLLVGGTPMPNV